MSSTLKRKRAFENAVPADASAPAIATNPNEPVDLLQPVQSSSAVTSAFRAPIPAVTASRPLPDAADGSRLLLPSSDACSDDEAPVTLNGVTAASAIDVPPVAGAIMTAPESAAVLRSPGGAALSGGNRARFMAGMQPSKVSCDLTSAPTNPGMRFSFEAIIVMIMTLTTMVMVMMMMMMYRSASFRAVHDLFNVVNCKLQPAIQQSNANKPTHDQ
jgi:hypothetical protein